MDLSFLSDLEIKRHCKPWNHYVIDQFLPVSEFRKIQKQLCSFSSGFQKREDDKFDIRFMCLPDFNLMKLFLSNEFENFLNRATGEKFQIYEKALVQLRKMSPESPAFPAHIDSQEERSLVCLWYISPGWDSKKGGELNLLKNEASTPADLESKIIEPFENRMVLFFSDERNWHSVNKVRDWQRYSVISEWIVH